MAACNDAMISARLTQDLLWVPAPAKAEYRASITPFAGAAARKAPSELSQTISDPLVYQNLPRRSGNREMKVHLLRRWPAWMMAIAALSALLAGCGGTVSGSLLTNTFSVSPGSAIIDTNCTGCNTTNSSNEAVEQFTATLSGGSSASVTWSVSGGDANSGPGTITSAGQYTPPSYLTADRVQVTVTATLSSSPSTQESAIVTITPGFLQPLTPENAALGSGDSVAITGYIAEVGGATSINYAPSSTSTGSSGGQGSVGSSSCAYSTSAFTYCTVIYTAPGTISSTAPTYVVATIGSSSSKEATEVLLNTEGISSNPSAAQVQLPTPILLGSSGGNNNDYDTNGNQIVDCCSGTLGSLIQNSRGTQYLLSCNHVLARSDQANVGEMIIQPGLIDNNCTPNGEGSGTTPVGVLTAWLPLSSGSTNADAAIAQVDSGAVSSRGNIRELGALQTNGTLAAAPPGISSTHGKGESASINLVVAKSGRTTGLTCASISALDLEVKVDYYTNCAETDPYLTKTYTNQIAIEGNQFSDAGDSGSLVVDVSNAEPVGLFFAGGVTNSGVSEGVANPAPDVLSELGTQEGTTFTFVGTKDHAVSCLNYGDDTVTAAQAQTLSDAQAALARQAHTQAHLLVDPSAGILGVATGKSNDHAGEATVILYVDQTMNVAVPQTVAGVRTEVISTTPQALASGTEPQSIETNVLPPLSPGVLNQAVAAKQQVAQALMILNPSFFGVGVGQSFDNPREAALVIYVDRKKVPASLPVTIGGLRTRYIIMDRLHVTRSYMMGSVRSQSHCMSHSSANQPGSGGTFQLQPRRLPGLNLF